MSTRVVERVDDWDQRAFPGGHGELEALADEGFSGVIRAGGAELFMTKGTAVGVRRGSIDDVAAESGTLYEAPSPALPLLAVMQDRSEEVRAEYYTEQTALSEVDGTLADGGFTGFVDLSENVLSGDYYQVYHAGNSMSVAFVGEAQRLLTGDEAFETADDEVGIYEVRPVEIDPIEIPDAPDGPGPEAGAEADDEQEAGGEGVAATEAGRADSDDEPVDEDDGVTGEGEETSGRSDPDPGTTDSPSSTEAGSGTSVRSAPESPESTSTEVEEPAEAHHEDRTASGREDETATSETTAGPATSSSNSEATTAESNPTGTASGSGQKRTETEATSGPDRSQAAGSTQPEDGAESADRSGSVGGAGSERSQSAAMDTGGAGSAGHDDQRARDETAPSHETHAGTNGNGSEGAGQSGSAGGAASQLETRSIPSLDPSRTQTPQRESQTGDSARGDTPGRTQRSPEDEASTARSEREAAPKADSGSTEPSRDTEAGEATADQESSDTSPGAGSTTDLQSALAEKEAEIDRLESELASATDERDALQAELDEVREERDELATEVERLESELERLEGEFGAATDAERRLTPQEALSGTDIFVRYHSKGDATLEKAHGGSVRKEDVTENLRLEKHTQFEADEVAVGGQAYEEFLEGTVEYRFIDWVVTDLLFEIRDTGHDDALKTLYDALPKVDRAEIDGVVNVVITEDGQETRTDERFDVVLRDRMGNPLLVANLNDSREAATQGMMEGLVTAAERVGQSSETLACAFLVTRSFFEPEALETASEATRGGLLSRDKRRSFVNLSRKQGYHLCLVEARNENFHLAVPEL